MPSDALFARGQMAYSLGFHILFASVGIAMPLLMVLAELRWLRGKDPEHLELARRWAKGTAVFFAVGAVSGTVLSFELGLLFPGFMRHAGAIVGLPFSLEGFAFFTEAIFLGIYLYGWDKVGPRLHVFAGVIVALSGLASAVFVTLVNAWMNTPRGFRLVDGQLVDIDPLAAMASPFVAHEVLHTCLAAYMTTGLAVAAIHAWALLRSPARRSFHVKALVLALLLAVPSSLLQPLVGHLAGQQVGEHQPLKLAAMEGLMHTQARAPLHVGPVAIPGLLSFLVFGDDDAVVTGLDAFPRADWPHPVVAVAYQVMIILGTACAGFAAATVVLWLRRRRRPGAGLSPPDGAPLSAWTRRWLWVVVALGPAGAICTEAGWTVTEVGRQPWTVYGVLRTADAVTPVTGLWVRFTVFALVYLLLAVVVAVTLWRQVRATTEVRA
jgi:cytochrome bd ubiquinol oxidase subunit I